MNELMKKHKAAVAQVPTTPRPQTLSPWASSEAHTPLLLGAAGHGLDTVWRAVWRAGACGRRDPASALPPFPGLAGLSTDE